MNCPAGDQNSALAYAANIIGSMHQVEAYIMFRSIAVSNFELVPSWLLLSISMTSIVMSLSLILSN
jgi:hypothetical protein